MKWVRMVATRLIFELVTIVFNFPSIYNGLKPQLWSKINVFTTPSTWLRFRRRLFSRVSLDETNSMGVLKAPNGEKIDFQVPEATTDSKISLPPQPAFPRRRHEMVFFSALYTLR